MSEYVVDFSGIGIRMTKSLGCCFPFVRELDKERKERVIRCRDCWWHEDGERGVKCSRYKNFKPYVKPNGFCAWGEAKGE